MKHSKENASEFIVSGVGGVENIQSLDCCATRLRIKVVDPQKINEDILKKSGCAGVIKKGEGIQVVFGPRVTVIKAELEEYIESLKSKSTVSE